MQTDPNPVIMIKLFKFGDQVIFNGKQFTVNHVRIVGYDLFVQLDGHPDFVNSMDLEANTTVIPFKRD
jgi:hypothetical protein